MKCSTVVCGIGVIALLVAADAARAAEAGKVDRVFVGYLYGRTKDVDFNLYSHICHAFLIADDDGRLRTTPGVPDRELTSHAHKAGVKVLLSLGGWGFDAQFAAMTADPEAEERYVRAVLAIVAQADYDGLDVDWEYPDTKREIAGFAHLVRQFRRELDALGKARGRPMLLTMAASSVPGTFSGLPAELLLETMDWINVMTYDYAGDWTGYAGHHAPLFASPKQPSGARLSAADTIAYLRESKKLPPDRLALGIPLYGRGFAVGAPYERTRKGVKASVSEGDYRSLHKLMTEQGWMRTWDEDTKTPWLSSPDRSVCVGYEDPESAAFKTRWAMRQGLRGVFFWQIAGDRLPDGTNPVQAACRKALDESKVP